MALGAPDRLDADVLDKLARIRDRRIHIRAIVAVDGFELIGLAVDNEAAGVVDLLHRQLDCIVNGVAGGNERAGEGGVHADLHRILFSCRPARDE